MVNRVVLVGRLGKDPEVRVTGSGVSVCRMSLAVTRRFPNQQGERETDWFDVVAWRGTAEFCGRFLAKGALIAVDGRIQTREWQTREGETRRAVEIVAESVQSLARPRGAVEPAAAPADAAAGPPQERTAELAGPKVDERIAADFEEVFGDVEGEFDPYGEA